MKKIFLVLSAVLFCSLFVHCASLCAADVEQVLSGIENAEKNLKNISFEYLQTVSYTATGERTITQGTALFMRTGQLEIIQKRPSVQSIVSNGKKVWIYTPANKQVVVDSWKSWASANGANGSLSNFGTGLSDLKKDHTFSLKGEEPGLYVLGITPVKNRSVEMTAWVDKETFTLSRLVIAAQDMNITTVISGTKTNIPVEKGRFDFKVPRGTEVLDLP